jgi:hypothetical protein
VGTAVADDESEVEVSAAAAAGCGAVEPGEVEVGLFGADAASGGDESVEGAFGDREAPVDPVVGERVQRCRLLAVDCFVGGALTDAALRFRTLGGRGGKVRRGFKPC